MAANLRSDSPICRRVVRAFVDFLDSVQPAPDVDIEGLDVAKDCLEEVFKLNTFSSDDVIKPGMLVDLFSSVESGEQQKENSDLSHSRENTASANSSFQEIKNSTDFRATNGKDHVGAPHIIGGDLKDELLGKFFAGLDKINFFKTSSDGVEDPAQVAKASKLFDDALMEMEVSEGQIINPSNLADMFKLKGNRSMQSKSYSEAVELYTCAIALCQRNAVYFCNRAAAFTEMHKYTEAIRDCLKSIEINPSYSKAYSRLGLAYYAQGNYNDALKKGFLKALQLDPSNVSVKENVRVAQEKLVEQFRQAEASQNVGSNHGQRSSAQRDASSNEGIRIASFSFGASAAPDNVFQSAWSGGGSSSSFFSFTPPTPPDPPNPPQPPEFASMSREGTQAAGSTDSSTPSASFSFNASTPVGLAEVLRSVASSAQGQQPSVNTSSGTSDGADGPEIRMDENTGYRVGEAQEHVSEVLRSVMGMFSSQHGSQDTQRGNES